MPEVVQGEDRAHEGVVDLGDLELSYEVRGTGPRLLVLNGSGATRASSRPLLDTLSRSFTIAVHDQRGLGRTGLGRTSGDFSMADYARDGRALLDHLEWPEAAVFGISFGGMVAQEFAVTWPERITRLCLLCTSSGGAGGSSYPLHELASLSPTERADVSLKNLDTRFNAEWLQEHPRDRALVEMMASGAVREKSEIERAGEAAQLRARAGHDCYDRLGAISAPTLVAAGEFDGLAPLANSVTLAARIHDCHLRIYQGGHLFLYQDERAFEHIRAFLAEGGPGAFPA